MEFIFWVKTRLAGKTLAVKEVAKVDRCANGAAPGEIALTLQEGKIFCISVQRNIVQTQIQVGSDARFASIGGLERLVDAFAPSVPPAPYRGLHTVVSSGSASTPRSMPAKLRIEFDSYKASSTAGSEVEPQLQKYTRNIRCSG